MKRRRPLLRFASLLTACTACGGTRSNDASLDADATAPLDVPVSRRDAAADARDAADDTPTPAPWLDGTLALPVADPYRWPENRFRPCAGRPALAPVHPAISYRAHWWNGTIYASVSGYPLRVVPGSGTIELLNYDNSALLGMLAVSGEHLIYGAAWSSPHAEAVIAFDRAERGVIGRTLWHRERVDTGSEGGFSDLSASSSLIAFSWQNSRESGDWRTLVYAMNPDGSDLRVLSPPLAAQSGDVRVDGDRVVFRAGGQIYLWQRGDAEARPIDTTRSSQWHPWIDGDHVVWIDQRDSPRGSLYEPFNPEVYYKNLRTGVVQRITHDPATSPVFQADVVVAGDWIVWTDLRHASNPNPSSSLGDRIAIYGFHLPTQSEHALVNEPECLTWVPLLLGGRLFVAGQPVGQGNASTYEFPLPSVPRDS